MSLRDAWDAQAEAWAAWARSPRHDHYFYRLNLPRFLELVPEPGWLTVDLGCGEGRVGRVLQQRGHRVVAFDGSPALATLTRDHGETQPVAVADISSLPVRDRVADLAVAFMSLQDVDDLGGAVREAARVLQPGGRLCVAVVHPINGAGSFESDELDGPFVIRGSYVESQRYEDTIDRDGLAMTFHGVHHSFETYFRTFEDAGFVLETLREPVPDPEHVASEPAAARWQRVPLFLHLRAVKRRGS